MLKKPKPLTNSAIWKLASLTQQWLEWNQKVTSERSYCLSKHNHNLERQVHYCGNKEESPQSTGILTSYLGSKCWATKCNDVKRLKAFELRSYRWLLSINWTKKYSNDWVTEKIWSTWLFESLIDRMHALVRRCEANGLEEREKTPRTRFPGNVKGMARLNKARLAQEREVWRNLGEGDTAARWRDP